MGNLGSLFLSLEGRIRRGQFWLGFIAISLVELALDWACGVPVGGDPMNLRQRAFAAAIAAVTIYPTAAVAAKRLHDRDQSAAYVWLLVAAFVVTLIANFFGLFDEYRRMDWIELVLAVAVGATMLGFLVELGFRRGTAGPNRYGPAPA